MNGGARGGAPAATCLRFSSGTGVTRVLSPLLLAAALVHALLKVTSRSARAGRLGGTNESQREPERERERESVCLSVCVCVCTCVYDILHSFIDVIRTIMTGFSL